ncbi:hypothetical protein BDF14DRAFT_1768968 [Spinellus fusiger]|nr:hypothetical protein BDF14DRAFT_1768968 [Spinellus fusiger]
MWLTHKFSTLIQSDTNDTLSRKNSTYKKRGLSQPTSPPDIPPLKTLAIAVTGACNVGTSTLIQLGLQDSHQKQSPNTASCQRHPSIFTIKHIRYLVDRMETSASLIDATEDPPEPTESLADIHGGLICYDLNNPGSMECLPELLSVYVARNIPTYLVGLKTDLIEEGSSVNVQLGHQLADRFGVQLFQVDAHTEKGILDIRAMWASLVQQCIHRHTHPPPPTQTLTLRERRMASESSISITIDHKPILCKLQDEMKQRSAMTDPDSDDESPVSYSDYQFPPIDPPTSDPSLSLSPTSRTKAPAGFVYAPTALEDYPRGKDTYSRRSNLPTAVGLTAEERDLGTTPDGAVALSCKERLVLDGMHRKNSLPSSPHFSYQRGSASHDFNARRRGSAPQTALSNLANSRRGSKDSSYSDSYSNGMTVDAIVDRLLLSEPYRVDEHIIPIFITFFRKFMKPGDLVRMLVERFENDDLSSPPTPLQQRMGCAISHILY